MENQNHNPFGDATNNAFNDEKSNDKKPVGYGSSTQTDGTGNHSRPVDHSKNNPEKVIKDEEQSESDAASGHV